MYDYLRMCINCMYVYVYKMCVCLVGKGFELKAVDGTSLCMFNTYKIKIKFHQQITHHKYKFSAVLAQFTLKRNALSGGGLGGA